MLFWNIHIHHTTTLAQQQTDATVEPWRVQTAPLCVPCRIVCDNHAIPSRPPCNILPRLLSTISYALVCLPRVSIIPGLPTFHSHPDSRKAPCRRMRSDLSPHSDISGSMSSITLFKLRAPSLVFHTPLIRAYRMAFQKRAGVCYRKPNPHTPKFLSVQIPISYVRHELFSNLPNPQ